MEVSFLPNLANTTTAPTFNLCTLGAKAITKLGTTVLANNDLVTTAIADVIYDGTEWQLQNPQTTSGGGSPALSSITAAVASNSISNLNNPQTWQWAQTTNSQNGLTLNESSASTAGTITSNLANQSILEVITLPASTANPLSVQQGSITGSLAIPALQIKSTWNNAAVDQGLLLSVTDTAHAAGSKLFNIFAGASGGTTEFSVDTVGNTTQAGNWRSTASPATGTGTTALPLIYPNAGTAPTDFNTNGTEFGVNAPSGFTGNMLDFHVNGVASVAKLDYQGNLTVVSCVGCGPAANTTFTNATTLLTANTCSAAGTTVSMTGVTTASTFSIPPSVDINASAGWGSTGGLVIIAWPTSNTLNYKICNQTSASITPGAVTWNVSAR